MTNINMFAPHSEGAVVDTSSGLIWTEQDVADGRVPCSTAVDAIESLNDESLGGLNNWRFPSEGELIALAERVKHSRANGYEHFSSLESDLYWTDPAAAENPSEKVWFISFEQDTAPRSQCSNRARVLAVADAPTE